VRLECASAHAEAGKIDWRRRGVAFSIGANLTMRVSGLGAHGNVGRGGGTALRDLFSGQIRFDFLI
jgi:ribosomal protein L27